MATPGNSPYWISGSQSEQVASRIPMCSATLPRAYREHGIRKLVGRADWMEPEGHLAGSEGVR